MITPLEYHIAGLITALIVWLIAEFGPEDWRGWAAGFSTPTSRVVALILVALFWPPIAFGYAVAAVISILRWAWRLDIWERFFQTLYGLMGVATLIAAGYLFIFSLLPWLAHWYGLVR